jgi:hypothetical protein
MSDLLTAKKLFKIWTGTPAIYSEVLIESHPPNSGALEAKNLDTEWPMTTQPRNI